MTLLGSARGYLLMALTVCGFFVVVVVVVVVVAAAAAACCCCNICCCLKAMAAAIASSDKFEALASVLIEYPIVCSVESIAAIVGEGFCSFVAPALKLKMFVEMPASDEASVSFRTCNDIENQTFS